MKRVLESSFRGPCTPENDTAFSVIVFDVSWGNLVSGQTRSIAGVKLFCCLFAMMDKAPCSVFAACLVFFEATLDTLVYFMADVPAVFSVASHRWLCLSTVAPSAPLLSAQWYTHKKTIFCEHDIACFSGAGAHCTVPMCFFHHKCTAGCSRAQPWFLSAAFERGQSVACTYTAVISRWRVVGDRRDV